MWGMISIYTLIFDSYVGDDIYIYFDNDEIADSPLVVPETGSFSFNFVIPADADPEVHWIRVKSDLGSTLAKRN